VGRVSARLTSTTKVPSVFVPKVDVCFQGPKGVYMSAEQQIDYFAVLADMEAKRTALDAAIASMRKFLNGQAGGSSTGESAPGSASFTSGEIPTGAFLGKSIPDAATLYLQIMKRKSTTREIAEGLRKGGMESTSSNFPSIVHAILDRYRKAGGEIVKLDKSTWGLASWFPAGVRSAAVAQEKRTPTRKHHHKRKQKLAKRKTETVAQSTIVAEPESAAPIAESTFKSDGTPYQRIAAFLTANPLTAHSLEKISGAIGLKVSVTAMHMGNLVKHKKAEKTANGEYRSYMELPLAG
jgi:hypothetical protein